uniref:ISXO2-like transposase domain-containing protein n=1 Tax=Candidatus Kentrum sp. SD TaxID=2126332 RepID=A0A451BK67_9GAMM|nr:MAG: hypothetical protein BECKSD772D_GA0070982_102220 [Candidatus Kentron sp. SD]
MSDFPRVSGSLLAGQYESMPCIKGKTISAKTPKSGNIKTEFRKIVKCSPRIFHPEHQDTTILTRASIRSVKVIFLEMPPLPGAVNPDHLAPTRSNWMNPTSNQDACVASKTGGAAGKPSHSASLDHNGRVLTGIEPDIRKSLVLRVIRDRADFNSAISSDEWRAYDRHPRCQLCQALRNSSCSQRARRS